MTVSCPFRDAIYNGVHPFCQSKHEHQIIITIIISTIIKVNSSQGKRIGIPLKINASVDLYLLCYFKTQYDFDDDDFIISSYAFLSHARDIASNGLMLNSLRSCRTMSIQLSRSLPRGFLMLLVFIAISKAFRDVESGCCLAIRPNQGRRC